LSVGVHWGTFRLCDDPIDQVLDEFPKAAKAAGLKDGEFVLPALGQTFVLQRGVKTGGQAATAAASSSSSSPKNPPL
jgi:hypothetical protein